MSNEWVSTDALAVNEAEQVPPYVGSQVNQPWNDYIAPGCVVADNAPTPEVIWLLATYDPMFYVGLMAKYGYTVHAWKSIQDPPPAIKPYIPPRPVPAYIGIQNGSGSFVGVMAPEFTA